MKEETKKTKKFNKKYLAFGILGLFALALVSAGLIGYISNTVQVDVSVSSPILQEIHDGTTWSTTNLISFDDVKGGEPVTFYVRDTNLANVPITGVPENRVTNVGVTCADFESVMVTTTTKIDSTEVVSGPWDLIDLGLCSVDGADVVFSYGPSPLVWEVGQEDTSDITVTFKTDATGTYTFTSNILPA